MRKGLLGALIVGGLAAMAPLQAATVGNSLIARGNSDSCGGCDFIFNTAFTVGDTITGWSYFSNVGLGQPITPFLIDVTTDTITGVGTTQTNTASGIQSFSFGLVNGSAVTTANTRFAFHDGGPSTNSAGTISYNTAVDTVEAGYWFPAPGVTIATGNSLGSPTVANSGRYYSLQVTSSLQVSAAPEPGSGVLIVGFLGGLWLVRRRG